MAKDKFTFDEFVYNSVLSGKIIYYKDVQKTIDYVKLVKDTRQVQVFCTDGAVFLTNQNDVYEFETTITKQNSKPTLEKLKGVNR